ncbi:sulfate ABC transporter substrate-binding protein [Paenibacillus qinlingensis]|uniref:Sulfate transport system substrate-binding protein n=1 Tax=Paenibacillus qinlingensis TaxID=1837343 RepID=A0ABU1NQG9_9BACL|nr:sulfate ABC transporter substrate-binding protein [Paenibacillus qinlingensis]MDR6549723.1 sulfate transport system substrate-binding protein [Paenibacillus qinlingensis]
MKKFKSLGLVTAALFTASITLTACGSGTTKPASSSAPTAAATTAASSAPKTEGGKVTITIGAYSILKDSFEVILPKFKEDYKKKTGTTVEFQESYVASGSQATAIIQGFEADIAPLSLEGDIQKIVEKGLITHDWKNTPQKGFVTTSIAAIGVREGNPKGIKDWSDLTKPGVEVLIPNPSTSGGAKWDINAVYGAGLKISEAAGKQDPAVAKDLVAKIYKNIKVLDKSGADSLTTFDKGVGDAIITYENELIARIQTGKKYVEVVPQYTTSIENPVAIIDKYVDKHGNREAVQAFYNYLFSADAQKVFADKGFRSVLPEVAKQYEKNYTTPAGLFNIEYLGGWDKVNKELYGKGAIWETILAEGGAK